MTKKGKFEEILDRIHRNETDLNTKIKKVINEARISFLKIGGRDDEEVLANIYKWFQENFGEIK